MLVVTGETAAAATAEAAVAAWAAAQARTRRTPARCRTMCSWPAQDRCTRHTGQSQLTGNRRGQTWERSSRQSTRTASWRSCTGSRQACPCSSIESSTDQTGRYCRGRSHGPREQRSTASLAMEGALGASLAAMAAVATPAVPMAATARTAATAVWVASTAAVAAATGRVGMSSRCSHIRTLWPGGRIGSPFLPTDRRYPRSSWACTTGAAALATARASSATIDPRTGGGHASCAPFL